MPHNHRRNACRSYSRSPSPSPVAVVTTIQRSQVYTPISSLSLPIVTETVQIGAAPAASLANMRKLNFTAGCTAYLLVPFNQSTSGMNAANANGQIFLDFLLPDIASMNYVHAYKAMELYIDYGNSVASPNLIVRLFVRSASGDDLFLPGVDPASAPQLVKSFAFEDISKSPSTSANGIVTVRYPGYTAGQSARRWTVSLS